MAPSGLPASSSGNYGQPSEEDEAGDAGIFRLDDFGKDDDDLTTASVSSHAAGGSEQGSSPAKGSTADTTAEPGTAAPKAPGRGGGRGGSRATSSAKKGKQEHAEAGLKGTRRLGHYAALGEARAAPSFLIVCYCRSLLLSAPLS